MFNVQCKTAELGQSKTIQYSTVQCSTVQYNTVEYSVVQHSTKQYNTGHAGGSLDCTGLQCLRDGMGKS